MALRWTESAYLDPRRLYEFLEPADSRAALRAVPVIVARGERMTFQPGLDEQLPRLGSGEVRRVLAANYEIRYELKDEEVVVLRIVHTRDGGLGVQAQENRPAYRSHLGWHGGCGERYLLTVRGET